MRIVLIAGILLMIAALFSDMVQKSNRIADSGVRIMPKQQYQMDENTRKYEFSTQEISDTGHCVRFFTSHMAVWVYADDKLIYSVEQLHSVFGN